MEYNIYVTVGATIPFDGIVETLFDDSQENLFKHLATLHEKEKLTVNLVVQCGSTYQQLFSKYINNQFKESTVDKQGKELIHILNTNDYRNKSISVNDKLRVNVIFFNLSTNINKLLFILNPNLVITHAGTGSLLDAMNIQNVKILTVVNTSLMNNHQLEIAEKFEEYGVVTCCKDLLEFKKEIQRGSVFTIKKETGKKEMTRGFNKSFNDDILLF